MRFYVLVHIDGMVSQLGEFHSLSTAASAEGIITEHCLNARDFACVVAADAEAEQAIHESMAEVVGVHPITLEPIYGQDQPTA